MLITIALALLAIFVLKSWYNKRKIDNKLKGFVTPPGLPVFRHFFQLSTELGLLSNLLKNVKEYGSLLKMELFYGLPVLVVTDKDFIGYILSMRPIVTKDAMYKLAQKWLGNGLVCAHKDRWKKTRKSMNPIFHVQHLEQYAQCFSDPCKSLIEDLKKEDGSEGFNVVNHLHLTSLKVIYEVTFGIKLNLQAGNDNLQYMKDVDYITKVIILRLFSPLKRFPLTYMLTSDYWKERKAVARTHAFIRKIIEDRKQTRRMSNGVSTKDTSINGISKKKKISSILDTLLDIELDGQPLSIQDIIYETQTFLFGGQDTSASTISIILYCLSKYPQIQEKVLEELQFIFGDTNRDPNMNDLNEMKYLEMVVKESMRRYSPIPFISRMADEDIEFGDIFVPKGFPIMIFLQGLHKNPEYFPDPEKFDPSRFETQNTSFTFMPFGSGPRNCIGQRLAMLEVKYVVCQILRNFIILPVSDHTPQLTAAIMLRFKNGFMIRVESR